jgi:hypothetical protein
MAATISGSGTSTLIDLTTSGNTTLGDATTDTLTVGVTGIVKDASGNVGIGTASPADKLHVAFSIGGLGGIRVQNTNATGQAALSYYNDAATQKADIWWNNSGSTLNLRTLSTDPMVFSTNNTERMRIDSSGNFFVGTTSQFSGAKNNFRRTGSGQVMAIVTSITSGTNDMMAFLDGDENVCGYIQANTTANTVSYVTSSDYRLKDNIQSMTGGLTKVMQLKPSTWNWKSAPEVSGQGFIAHELQAIVPDAVCGEKDELYDDGNPKFQGIDTSFLVATLTAAIQEQQALITQLQADVAALKGKA